MLTLRTLVLPFVIVGAVPLMAAASAGSAAFASGPVYTEATIGNGTAPAAPDPAPSGVFTPAPMPDLDRQAPLPGVAEQSQTRVAPKLYHAPGTYNGEGYVFGSTAEDRQDQRARPGPGVNLIMPLQ